MKGFVFTVRSKKTDDKPKTVPEIRKNVKKRALIIMLTVFLFSGAAVGILFADDSSVFGAVNSFFGFDILTGSRFDFFAVFAAQLSASFILLFVIFILGVSAAGTPFLPFAAAVKGIGIGSFISSLFGKYGIKGIIFYALTCLPGDVILIFALFSECMRALSLSLKLGKMLFFNKAEGSYAGDDIKDFVVHSSYILIFSALAAALNTLLHFVFAGLSGVAQP